MERELAPPTHTQIIDPTPERRKLLMEKLLAFVEDRACIADLKGVKKSQLQQLADMGHVKLKHGRIDEAEKIFKALLLLDHRNAYYHAGMGAVHQKLGRIVQSISEYSFAVRLNKKDVSSRVNRGEIYLRHKNYRKAADDFRTAILLDPNGINLWANRARSLVIALKRSIELDQKIAVKRYNTKKQTRKK